MGLIDMVGTWMRLAHVPLTSAGDTINTGDFEAKENLRIIFSGVGTNASSYPRLRFNGTGDSDNDYAYRQSMDGATDATPQVNQNHINTTGNVGAFHHYFVADVTNVDGKEKLVIVQGMDANTAGADNVPRRREVAGKWDITSGQITSVQITDLGNHNFASGAYITVFGATGDIITDEKTTLTNVPANSRYEETNTRKIFRAKSGKTWTESTQDNWWSMYENYYYGIKLGASFELNGETISQVKVWLKKSGSPTYNTTVEVIRGSTVEATSATVAMSTVTSTTGEWITYTFSSGVALQENDYIVFKQDGNQSSSNYVFVGNATKSGTVTTWWSNSPFSAQSHSGVIATMEVTSSTGMTWTERNTA
jgi:uncharacterized protein with FMN-binding domain